MRAKGKSVILDRKVSREDLQPSANTPMAEVERRVTVVKKCILVVEMDDLR